MDLSNVYTILGIIVSTLILISIIYRFWKSYNQPTYEIPTVSGGRRMRKLRK